MKSVKLILLFLSIIILNNCSHYEVKIDAVASPDQMTDYDGVVTSEKQQVVSLASYELGRLKDKTAFIIIVENYGDKPIDFSNKNISVMFEGNSVDWSLKEIHVEAPIEVMMDTQREVMARNMRNMRNMRGDSNQGFSGVLTGTSSAAGGSSVAGSAGSNATGNAIAAVNSAASSGVPLGGITITVGGGNQNFAREMAQMRMDSINTYRAQSFYLLPRMIIKPEIIMPNESMSGIFVCDTSEMKGKVEGDFKITVTIDGEEHKFTFTRKLI